MVRKYVIGQKVRLHQLLFLNVACSRMVRFCYEFCSMVTRFFLSVNYCSENKYLIPIYKRQIGEAVGRKRPRGGGRQLSPPVIVLYY